MAVACKYGTPEKKDPSYGTSHILPDCIWEKSKSMTCSTSKDRTARADIPAGSLGVGSLIAVEISC